MSYDVYEYCADCEHDNIYENYDPIANGYKARCMSCGREIMLCDECFHAEDNLSQNCDWHGETKNGLDYGECFRGKTVNREWGDEAEDIYRNTFSMMRAYSQLSSLDREIIALLFKTNVLQCTYTSLAKMLYADLSNTRKAVLRLRRLGIVFMVKDETKKVFKPMTACGLVSNWMDILKKEFIKEDEQ